MNRRELIRGAAVVAAASALPVAAQPVPVVQIFDTRADALTAHIPTECRMLRCTVSIVKTNGRPSRVNLMGPVVSLMASPAVFATSFQGASRAPRESI
jgi:hypothetical protein